MPLLVATIVYHLTTSAKYDNNESYMELLEYFRLDEEPFRLSPSPRFLYLNDQVKEASAKVTFMTRHRTAPLYIYGAIGSGKTSILRRLYEELREEETYNLQMVIAPNIKTSNSFLRAIMDTFNVTTAPAYERSVKLFERFLMEQYKEGKVPTLFVDEAQNMTRDILKLIHHLLNFETSDVKLLQVVLTGQEELSDKVKKYRELSSRMIPIAINSMSPGDLEAMLRFRWNIASGSKSDLPFTEEAFTQIFTYSKGLPRDAIKLSDEVLRHLYLRQLKTANSEQVDHAAKQLDLEK
jgi:general secretion pathway protein A